MTTFQTIVFAIIDGISEFLPISAKAHHILVPYLIGWQPPTGALLGALTLGSFLAILIYFRDDWASMISAILQVILFRKRPMTLDEKLPLFIAVTSLPIILASTYVRSNPAMSEPESNPILIAGIFMVVGIPLWFFDHWSRKSKNIYDMNWWNAGFIGTLQALSFLPGVDLLSCALIGAFFCNYRREVAVKYAYFASAPILLARASTELKGVSFSLPSPMPDFSWLSFCTAILVTLLVGLLTIGGFLKHVQNKGMGQYLGYRVLFALGVFGFYWVHRTA